MGQNNIERRRLLLGAAALPQHHNDTSHTSIQSKKNIHDRARGACTGPPPHTPPTCSSSERQCKETKRERRRPGMGPCGRTRRGPPSLLCQTDTSMKTSSGAASPSALHTLPLVTHLVLFWLARTLGLAQGRIEHGTVASQIHADNDNASSTSPSAAATAAARDAVPALCAWPTGTEAACHSVVRETEHRLHKQGVALRVEATAVDGITPSAWPLMVSQAVLHAAA